MGKYLSSRFLSNEFVLLSFFVIVFLVVNLGWQAFVDYLLGTVV